MMLSQSYRLMMRARWTPRFQDPCDIMLRWSFRPFPQQVAIELALALKHRIAPGQSRLAFGHRVEVGPNRIALSLGGKPFFGGAQ